MATLVMVGRNANKRKSRRAEDAGVMEEGAPTSRFSHCEIVFSCVMKNAEVDARRQGMEQRKLHHIMKKCIELRIDYLVVLANLKRPEVDGVQTNWWEVMRSYPKFISRACPAHGSLPPFWAAGEGRLQG